MHEHQSRESITLPDVRAFTRALRDAVADVKAERDRTIDYYFDADVTFSIILGFRQFQLNDRQRDRSEYIVQALLSTGLLTTIRILRPHALELNEKLSYQPEYRSVETRELFRDEARNFVNDWGIAFTMNELNEILASGLPKADIDRSFLDTIRRHAPRAFFALEFIRGTWQQRLERLWNDRLLVFDTSSPDVRALFNLRELHDFKDAIAARRDDSHDINTLRDAAALTALNLLLRQGKSVRFYTETRALRDLATGDARISALLRDRNVDDASESTILRTADYFLVRANFEALGFSSPAANPVVSFDELAFISEQLNKVVLTHPDRAMDVAASTKLGKARLGEVIRDLRTAAFLQNVIGRPAAASLTADFEEWMHVWRYAQGVGRSELVVGELTGARDELNAYVQDAQVWFAYYHQLQRAAANLHASWHAKFIPDSARDLGLVRWGVALEAPDDEILGNLLRHLVSANHTEVNDACTQLASMLDDVAGDTSRTIVVALLLWILRLYRLVERVLSRRIETSDESPVPVGLHVWRAAAMLKGRLDADPDDLRQIVLSVESVAPPPSASTHASYLLGLGFLYYYVSQAIDARGMNTSDARDYAKKSFDVGWSAKEALTPLSLEWSFAVNHCAYVGATTDVDGDRADAALKLLRKTRSTPHWHYRFADTLAYREYRLATRMWAERRGRDCDHGTLCARLDEALQFLNDAVPNFGDTEIDQHAIEVRDLLRDAGCHVRGGPRVR